MHIKKTEIFGFKSFGFRNTTVEFQPGLVSISGPNGSGKSNVLDAIIFALGENRPSMMRVSKLGKLLNDSGGRKPGTRLARCSVHFDNSDRKIPVDSDKVKITRELDEKGENTYYINDRKTQRSHMLNLLETANALATQTNAIQQGTVTKIAEATQTEIREFIEDLAGLTSFDEKKESALKQLDDADRKLEIVLAKTNETKKRVEDLEEERNFKLRYDMLDAEIRRFKAIDAANRLQETRARAEKKQEELEKNKEEMLQWSEERKQVRRTIDSQEAKKEDVMGRASAHHEAKAKVEREIADGFERLARIENRIQSAKSEIEIAEKSCSDLGALAEKERKASKDFEEKSRNLERDAAEAAGRHAEKKSQVEEARDRLDAALEEQSKVEARNSEIDGRIDHMRERLNGTRLALKTTMAAIAESESKADSDARGASSLRSESPRLRTAEKRLGAFLDGHERTAARLGEELATLGARRKKIAREIAEIEPFLDVADRAATEFSARIKTIKKVMHEDYSISQLRENADRLGIRGLVYEVLSWEKGYERAVLAAGSDWIKAVVVRDFDTLLGLAEYAHSNRLPKIKMVPYETGPPARPARARGRGVLGVLADFVSCEPKYDSIREFLFGQTVLVETVEAARAVSRSGIRAVTLEGDLIEPRSAAAVVDSNSKIARLTRAISRDGSVESLLESISRLREYLKASKSALEGVDRSIEERRAALSEAEKRLAAARQVRDMGQKTSDLSARTAELDERSAVARRRARILQARATCQESWARCLGGRLSLLAELRSAGDQRRIGARISGLMEKKSALESELSEILGEINRMRLEAGQARNGMGRAEDAERRHREEIGERRSRAEDLHRSLPDLERSRREHEEALERLRGREQEMISTSENSMEQVREYDRIMERERSRDRRLTKEIGHADRTNVSLSRDISDLRGEAERLRALAGNAVPRSDPGLGELLGELQGEQEGMPALNAKSPDDYLAISGLYRSMSDRKNTLQMERNKIVKFIEANEKEKLNKFYESFDKVNQDVGKTFEKATGGNAWLEIQDEDNVFESGISYMIQFPNEPKRESTAISGGEKSLAAIIFVMALQRLNPSPFYLFDEVDAALDAQNSERLSKILVERASGSRFIMVSLKDTLVRRAGMVYGVYAVNGVSHLLSYKDRRLPEISAGGYSSGK